MKKSQAILARLMANENIRIIQNSNHNKPHFSLAERVLAMPAWEDINEHLEISMLAEEVGHALFTPQMEWATLIEETQLPQSLFEVLEDVRVNTLMLEKYPGLDVDYHLGYKHALEEDLWKIKDADIDAMSIVDRINIKSKFRSLVDVTFSEEETVFLKDVADMRTWDDMIKCADAIWEEFFAEAEATRLSYMAEDYYGSASGEVFDGDHKATPNNYVGENPSQDEDDYDDHSDGTASYKDGAGSGAADSSGQTSGGYGAITFETFSATLDSMIAEKREVVLDIPSMDVIKSRIVPYADVAAARENPLLEVDVDIMNEVKKNVGLMLNEFNMRQAAQQFARARVSRKGSLDVNKLHRYKYDDNIFQQVTTLPNAKSHGMVMIVDMSSSMSNVLDKIRYQAGVLASFCNRAGIPFIVYGFTNGGVEHGIEDSNVLSHIEMASTRMVELISSDLTKAQFNAALSHLLVGTRWTRGVYDMMGGTPLGEVMCSMTRLIPMHQQKWNVEKMSFVSLCDGGGFRMGKFITAEDRAVQKVSYRYNSKISLRMPCGEIVPTHSVWSSHNYEELVTYLRKTGVATLGYHIVTKSSDADWPKHRGILRTDMVAVAADYCGFDSHFVIYNKGLDVDGSFDDHDSSFKRPETQFKHFMKGKKAGRTIARKVGETIG